MRGFLFIVISVLLVSYAASLGAATQPTLVVKPSRDLVHKLKPDPAHKHTVYTILPGESYWSIAKKIYGNPYEWPLFFWNNDEHIPDPENIPNGTRLIICKNVDSPDKNMSIQFASKYDRKNRKEFLKKNSEKRPKKWAQGPQAYASDFYGKDYTLFFWYCATLASVLFPKRRETKGPGLHFTH